MAKVILTETHSGTVAITSPTLWDADTNTQVSTSTNTISGGAITL